MVWWVCGLGVGVGVIWYDIVGYERVDMILFIFVWVDLGLDVVEVVDGLDDFLVFDIVIFCSLMYE